jgi:hypothetical protein
MIRIFWNKIKIMGKNKNKNKKKSDKNVSNAA